MGQFQSQRAFPGLTSADPEVRRASLADLRRVFATFQRLERRFPGSAAGWSGEADAELRVAYEVDEPQPFSARSRFRRALGLYRKARALDPDPGLAAGEARALAGLRLYGAAVRAQRGSVARADSRAPLEARLVEYLERDRRFAEAAATAARLAASARFPTGSALFLQQRSGDEEDTQEALSLGSDRLVAVSLDVTNSRTEPPVFTGSTVRDLSSIPEYRNVGGVTGYDRWCPGWSARRDLILAGRAEEALAGMPQRFTDIRPGRRGSECPVDGDGDGDGVDDSGAAVLAGVAELEAGHLAAATAGLTGARFDTKARRAIGLLQDARQNLWRFAGRLDKARFAAEAWTRQVPTSSTAFDRAGEVAFLAKDYNRAASLFATSARRARIAAGTWSLAEAAALLKRGTALELAGRNREALAVLAESDEVASRVYGLAPGLPDQEQFTATSIAAYLSYNARLQAGDTQRPALRGCARAVRRRAGT